MVEDRIFTTGEIARMCKVNLRTVVSWIKQGLLKSYKLPGARGDNRIEYRILIAFLKEHSIPIPQELKEKNNKVLIVDDEENVVHSIQRYLKRKGYETSTATNGFAVGSLLHSFHPAVVVLDLKMPGLNGFDIKYVSIVELHRFPEV